MSSAEILKDAQARMNKSIEVMQGEFSTLRTGRASAAILEGVRVQYYGTETPLLQLANIMSPDARTLEIKPYDPSAIGEIEKAIFQSNLGLTPQNDGKLVRVSFPPMTEERRKDLAKVVKKMSEDARVAIRAIRRDANDKIKAAEKAGTSQDESKGAETAAQKATDAAISKVDELAKKKESELLEI